MNLKMTETGSTLSQADLDSFEQEIGFTLPHSYRTFLLKYNGGNPEPCDFFVHNWKFPASFIDRFDGLIREHYNLDKAFEQNQGVIPTGFIQIASDPGGNLILISLNHENNGQIFFWDHENIIDKPKWQLSDYENLYPLADSFEAFLNSLKTEDEINRLLDEQATE